MWKTFFGGFLVRLLSSGVPARIAAWKTAAQRGALVAGAAKGGLKMWGAYEIIDLIVQSVNGNDDPITVRSDDEYKQLAQANGDEPEADFGARTDDPIVWFDKTVKILTRKHDVATQLTEALRAMQSTTALVKQSVDTANTNISQGSLPAERTKNILHATSELARALGIPASAIPGIVKNMKKLLNTSEAELDLVLEFANFGTY
jgi:hypothetical protein